jgi:hypothetical protein
MTARSHGIEASQSKLREKEKEGTLDIQSQSTFMSWFAFAFWI